MTYVDGFVIAVPTVNKDAYIKQAQTSVPIFKKYGALRCVENWGIEVPDGEITSFPMAVAAKSDETVVFAWIEWPSKEARDKGMELAMADPFFAEGEGMPFDGSRMIFGSFETIVDSYPHETQRNLELHLDELGLKELAHAGPYTTILWMENHLKQALCQSLMSQDNTVINSELSSWFRLGKALSELHTNNSTFADITKFHSEITAYLRGLLAKPEFRRTDINEIRENLLNKNEELKLRLSNPLRQQYSKAEIS